MPSAAHHLPLYQHHDLAKLFTTNETIISSIQALNNISLCQDLQILAKIQRTEHHLIQIMLEQHFSHGNKDLCYSPFVQAILELVCLDRGETREFFRDRLGGYLEKMLRVKDPSFADVMKFAKRFFVLLVRLLREVPMWVRMICTYVYFEAERFGRNGIDGIASFFIKIVVCGIFRAPDVKGIISSVDYFISDEQRAALELIATMMECSSLQKLLPGRTKNDVANRLAGQYSVKIRDCLKKIVLSQETLDLYIWDCYIRKNQNDNEKSTLGLHIENLIHHVNSDLNKFLSQMQCSEVEYEVMLSTGVLPERITIPNYDPDVSRSYISIVDLEEEVLSEYPGVNENKVNKLQLIDTKDAKQFVKQVTQEQLQSLIQNYVSINFEQQYGSNFNKLIDQTDEMIKEDLQDFQDEFRCHQSYLEDQIFQGMEKQIQMIHLMTEETKEYSVKSKNLRDQTAILHSNLQALERTAERFNLHASESYEYVKNCHYQNNKRIDYSNEQIENGMKRIKEVTKDAKELCQHYLQANAHPTTEMGFFECSESLDGLLTLLKETEKNEKEERNEQQTQENKQREKHSVENREQERIKVQDEPTEEKKDQNENKTDKNDQNENKTDQNENKTDENDQNENKTDKNDQNENKTDKTSDAGDDLVHLKTASPVSKENETPNFRKPYKSSTDNVKCTKQSVEKDCKLNPESKESWNKNKMDGNSSKDEIKIETDPSKTEDDNSLVGFDNESLNESDFDDPLTGL